MFNDLINKNPKTYKFFIYIVLPVIVVTILGIVINAVVKGLSKNPDNNTKLSALQAFTATNPKPLFMLTDANGSISTFDPMTTRLNSDLKINGSFVADNINSERKTFLGTSLPDTYISDPSWGVMNIKNADGRYTHFNHGDGKNYIRGPVTLDGVNDNLSVAGSISTKGLYSSSNITLNAPDKSVYGVELSRTDEANNWHQWKLLHMNEEYGRNDLQLWEYLASGATKRLTVKPGGDMTLPGTMTVNKLCIGGKCMTETDITNLLNLHTKLTTGTFRLYQVSSGQWLKWHGGNSVILTNQDYDNNFLIK